MTGILCFFFGASFGYALAVWLIKGRQCSEPHCLGNSCRWVQRGIQQEIREECERQGLRYEPVRWVM